MEHWVLKSGATIYNLNIFEMIKQQSNIQKGRLQKYSNKLKLSFGTLGLKALESGYLTSKQIQSVKQILLKKMNKKGKIWVKIIIDKPVTKKPLEVRMGKGKGSLSHKVARVKGGSLILEVCGLSKESAVPIFKTVGSKLPLKTSLFY
jgi:large subunit ribosomal protein L16